MRTVAVGTVVTIGIASIAGVWGLASRFERVAALEQRVTDVEERIEVQREMIIKLLSRFHSLPPYQPASPDRPGSPR